jgi:hypothetical protein
MLSTTDITTDIKIDTNFFDNYKFNKKQQSCKSDKSANKMENISNYPKIEKEYLSFDNLKYILELFKKNKNHDIDLFKNTIMIKFIDKNISYLDNLCDRIKFLMVETDNNDTLLLQIFAIYIGDKNSIKTLFNKSSIKKTSYQPLHSEIKIILNKLNADENKYDFAGCFLNNSCSNISLDTILSSDADTEFIDTINKNIHDQTYIFDKLFEYDVNKTHDVDIKIAFFRLIVGVAYRSFRKNITLDDNLTILETYKFLDLIKLIKTSKCLLSELKIFPESQLKYLEDLHNILQKKYNNIIKKIQAKSLNDVMSEDVKINAANKTNDSINTNASNTNATNYIYSILDAEINNNLETMQHLLDLKTYDLDIVSDDLISDDLISDVLISNNLDICSENNLTSKDHISVINTEIQKLYNHKNTLPYFCFKDRYSSVNIEYDNKPVQNALIKNSFWYDKFLPLLLRSLCVDCDFDNKIYDLIDISETTILQEDKNEAINKLSLMFDTWFETNKDIMGIYCNDVINSFSMINFKEKLIIKQCWDLTKYFFINNVKKYEINNDLSIYIPFIDEIVGTKYVMNYQLMPANSNYIGSSSWKLIHAIPEIMEKNLLDANLSDTDNLENQIQKFISKFIDFFIPFLITFPCPYCRNHINNFVIKNLEILNYPLEYIFMDWNDTDDTTLFKLNIDHKMKNIKTIDDLRLFLWKFHNAVNSSVSHNNTIPLKIISPSKSSGSSGSDESSESFGLYELDNSNNSDYDENQISDNEHNYNQNYTLGHWPDPNILPSEYKIPYNNILKQIIKHHREFVSMIISKQNDDITDQSVHHFNKNIQDNANKIKKDIIELDNIILNSKILQISYAIIT